MTVPLLKVGHGALALLVLLSGGCRQVNPLDPESFPRFTTSPAVSGQYLSSCALTAAVNRDACLVYAVVPGGYKVSDPESLLRSPASDPGTLSQGSVPVTAGDISFGVVLPQVTATYDIYFALVATGDFAGMMTLPTKRTVNFTPSGSYSYQNKWGGSGSGIAQFTNANGIALDDAGNLYVADKTNQRIQKFSHSGTYLTQWGSPGAGDGQFSDVVAVAVDPSGYVYACDWYNNRVQKFSSDGVFVSQWGSPGGIADGGDGHFDTPNYIAADRLGDIYVTESEWGANKRVQKFTGAGTYITKWSGAENGIAVDRWGNVFVTAYSAGVVKKFDSNGNFITQWAGMNGPDGIATDSSGYVYVSINGDSVVKKYTSTGTLVATIGTPGSGDGQLSGPAGLAVDAQGNLFVCDAGNSRIQVFR